MDINHILELLHPENQKPKQTLIEKKQKLVHDAEKRNIHTNITLSKPKEEKSINITPFSIERFEKELYELSELQNQVYSKTAQYMSAYDIAVNCIRQIVYKLTGTPVTIFANRWLPILMRSVIGNAIHDFIQENTEQFTELECSLKIPSLNFSGRVDALIGNNILVEIKSVPFLDYEKILKNKKPRSSDFFQTLIYKYILENYLLEAQHQHLNNLRTPPPKLDKYNIELIQFIYVAHDLTAADVEDFGQVLNTISKLKKMLKSRVNKFFFMMTMDIDVSGDKVKPHIEFLREKLDTVNEHLKNNTLPQADCKFIDTSKCFFCLYNQICDIKNNT